VFERFTDRARRVVVLSQEEARLLGQGYIGTEHILLGLIREGEGVAADVLQAMGISLEDVRDRVEKVVGRGEGAPAGHIPFTPRAKKVLELGLREALALKHNYIGTEHILLGMLREGEGLAAQMLVELGADLSVARQEVIRAVGAVAPKPGMRIYPEAARGIATPAATMVASHARRLAQGAKLGSQHYLLGLLGEEQSLAAKVLSSLGVTREAVERRLEDFDTAGTSDEFPDEAGARRMSLRVEAERLVLEVEDPEQAARLRQGMVRGAEARTIAGTDPEGRAAFPELYAALRRTVEELARRSSMTTKPFAPLSWDSGLHAAAYHMTVTVDGPVGRLDVGPGVDPVAMRAWLREWLGAERATLTERAPADGACSVSLIVDRAGESFRMFSFGIGDTGGAAVIPTTELVDAALADLAGPA